MNNDRQPPTYFRLQKKKTYHIRSSLLPSPLFSSRPESQARPINMSYDSDCDSWGFRYADYYDQDYEEDSDNGAKIISIECNEFGSMDFVNKDSDGIEKRQEMPLVFNCCGNFRMATTWNGLPEFTFYRGIPPNNLQIFNAKLIGTQYGFMMSRHEYFGTNLNSFMNFDRHDIPTHGIVEKYTSNPNQDVISGKISLDGILDILVFSQNSDNLIPVPRFHKYGSLSDEDDPEEIAKQKKEMARVKRIELGVNGELLPDHPMLYDDNYNKIAPILKRWMEYIGTDWMPNYWWIDGINDE